MVINPKSVSIENFKSIKNLSVDLSQLTLLIGPNGCGKSSIMEAISLAFEAVNYRDPSDNPFMKYWGFTNVVTDQDTDQLISISFKFNVGSYKVEYGMKVTGIGGKFKFVEELISIYKCMEIRRIGRIVKVNYDKNYINLIETHRDDIMKEIDPNHFINHMKIDIAKENEEINELDESLSILQLNLGFPSFLSFQRNKIKVGLHNIRVRFVRGIDRKNDIMILPVPTLNLDNITNQLGIKNVKRIRIKEIDIIDAIRSFFITQDEYSVAVSTWDVARKMIFLRHDYIYQMKQSVPINLQISKNIGGKEALIWLYKKYNEEGKIPDRISSAIDSLFPGWSIQFRITGDGNVILLVRRPDESGNILSWLPVSLPDGFFKLLLVMIFLEMKPSILMIDELENSLHYRIIDYIMDSLRESGIPVILTSHSPLAIDKAHLSEVKVLMNKNGHTEIEKTANTKNLAELLLKEGLTASDYYLYN